MVDHSHLWAASLVDFSNEFGSTSPHENGRRGRAGAIAAADARSIPPRAQGRFGVRGEIERADFAQGLDSRVNVRLLDVELELRFRPLEFEFEERFRLLDPELDFELGLRFGPLDLEL